MVLLQFGNLTFILHFLVDITNLAGWTIRVM